MIPSWHIFSLTIVFFLRVRSRTLCAQWTYHVLSGPAYLVLLFPVSRATGSCTRTFPSPFTCFLTCTNMDCWLVSGYLFFTHFPFYVCRLKHLRFSLMSFSLCLVDSSLVSLFLDSDSFLTRSPYMYLYLVPLYIRLGMGTCSPSSIYFATTLKVWPARSHELSSSSLAHWPRLLLCVS